MLKRFRIMNKNKIAATFDTSGNVKIYEGMPIWFTKGNCNLETDISIYEIMKWLEHRIKIMCARDVTEFLEGIGIKTVTDAVYVTNMVSLSDSFWVKEENSVLKWEDVSPFRRSYSEAVSRFALDGVINTNGKNYFSPVIGTDGSFPHAWKFNNGNIKFIKGSSKYTLGGSNSGREPYSEYYAGKVAMYLGFDCVEYKIRYHRRSDGNIDVVTECGCYTSEKYGAVPANLLGINKYEEVLEYCAKLGRDSYLTCLNMLFLDCLLLNTDRHMGNIEFIIDNDKLNVICIAPIFDNNYSLLPRFIEGYDTFDRSQYAARDGRRFEDLYKIITKHKDFKKELSALRKFKFKPPDNVKIDKRRLEFLNSFLDMQVKYLSELL